MVGNGGGTRIEMRNTRYYLVRKGDSLYNRRLVLAQLSLLKRLKRKKKETNNGNFYISTNFHDLSQRITLTYERNMNCIYLKV